jgi:hypothetical protein
MVEKGTLETRWGGKEVPLVEKIGSVSVFLTENIPKTDLSSRLD